MEREVKVIEKAVVYDGFFKLLKYKITHSLFGGGMSKPYFREILERGDAVAVLLHDPNRNEIVLIEQFRVGAIESGKPWITELVSGMVEEGESAEDVARREAEEEAGAKVSELEFIARYYNSVGGSSETCTLYYAQVDTSNIDGVHGLDSENEDIKVIKFTTKEFCQYLLNSRFNTASLVTAGYWFLNNKYAN